LPYKDENIRLKERLEVTETSALRRIDELSTQLEKAQEEIKKLNREIGRLEAQGEQGDR
jgi:DNA anti-recombination protein RmuC